MNILLTNDDGIDANGINSLYDKLSERHTVFMFAPLDQKSACSNAITVHSSVRVDIRDKNRYAVHGFPADCVYIGLLSGMVEPVDLVISGINHGPNLGNDVHYSGTVGGARTALIAGISSIAVSMNSSRHESMFHNCADYILDFIETNPLCNTVDPYFLNVNYPDLLPDDIKGAKVVPLGNRNYINSYQEEERSDNHVLFSLQGSVEPTKDKETDASEIMNGYITITPLILDATDYRKVMVKTT
ncbi:MAG: 5'/3'-nucleotidase SurE [Spirochaetes bacterium]|jgi:5'-nucleotidase|nr:5'/3'-nucleotidase SurE [Spirochaetota bacterium]